MKLISPLRGMEELIQSLTEKLKERGVSFLAGQDFLSSRSFVEEGTRERECLSKPFVFAMGLKQAQTWFLQGASQFMGESFQKLKVLSLVSVTLFYRSPSPFLGFGVLFPEKNLHALGVLNNGDIFEGRVKEGFHSETWIFGGEKEEEGFLEKEDKEWLQIVEEERLKVFRESSKPVYFKVSCSFEVFPSYNLELEKFLHFFKESFPFHSLLLSLNQKGRDTKQDLNREKWQRDRKRNIYFTGNYLGNIGLSQILEYNKDLSSLISHQVLQGKQ